MRAAAQPSDSAGDTLLLFYHDYGTVAPICAGAKLLLPWPFAMEAVMSGMLQGLAIADVVVAILVGLLVVVFVCGAFAACRDALRHRNVSPHVRCHR